MYPAAEAGALVSSAFGPVGTAVGGLIGGAVGYIGGEKAGQAVMNPVQQIQEAQQQIDHDQQRHGRGPLTPGLTGAIQAQAPLAGDMGEMLFGPQAIDPTFGPMMWP
jgi:hypothetical protein